MAKDEYNEIDFDVVVEAMAYMIGQKSNEFLNEKTVRQRT